MCVIEWSPMRLQTNRVTVTSLLKWARRPASKTVPIIPDRPQFLSCRFLQKTAQNTVAGFPQASDPKEEKVFKEEN